MSLDLDVRSTAKEASAPPDSILECTGIVEIAPSEAPSDPSTATYGSSEPRSFYGTAISCYEELYNLTGGDHELLDDQCISSFTLASSESFCRYFYGTAISCYEELYNLT